MNYEYNFPRQRISYKSKNKTWRKRCVDAWANWSMVDYSPVRKSIRHKEINYDLLNGKLHMEDLKLIFNPDDIVASYIPDKIQHYSIINSKLNILRGEEAKRVFDYRVIVTNPNAISAIEEEKKAMLTERLSELIQNTELSDEEFNQGLQKIQSEMMSWQSERERRANYLINHYSKEFNLPLEFNKGFVDAMAVGEELYQIKIVSGEPVVKKLTPKKVTVYKSGYSSKIEDADVIVIEDYWSPGKVLDTYYDVLKPADVEKIENAGRSYGNVDSVNEDPRAGFISINDESVSIHDLFPDEGHINKLSPYDSLGNVRVVEVFWKSARKIKKVKSYNPITGEEEYNLYTEDYIANKDMGEEETSYWINEAWHGTKIGEDIYVDMGPCPIQFNKLSNPSACHFGIIGSVYNINEDKPFSMVDIMKPYSYLYDVIHDRLNKLISKNWGKLIQLDLAKVPTGWEVDKWLHFAKINGLYITDSFKEGNKGAATGKLAGALNNASTGMIDAELGNSIQSLIQLLEYIKQEMSEVAGISKQREGQISNRETVGGVERATLQSSHITEWLFTIHDDIKKRVLECLLEVAKICIKGGSKKFQYILPDSSVKIVEIDGDQFCEADYGLVVDNAYGTQELKEQLPMLVQAGLQNQMISFSTAMKIYNSCSIAEKQKMIEDDESNMIQRQQQAQQEQLQQAQQAEQMRQQTEMAKMQQEDMLNQRDNETKILIATIQANSKQTETVPEIEDKSMSENERANLDEKIRQFNMKHQLDKDKLEFEKKKNIEDNKIKREQIHTRKASSSSK